MDGNRGRQIAGFSGASLTNTLTGDGHGFAVGPQRSAELGRSTYLHVLTDAKGSLENRNALVDGRHEEHFRMRINRWQEIQFGHCINRQMDRLISYGSR